MHNYCYITTSFELLGGILELWIRTENSPSYIYHSMYLEREGEGSSCSRTQNWRNYFFENADSTISQQISQHSAACPDAPLVVQSFDFSSRTLLVLAPPKVLDPGEYLAETHPLHHHSYNCNIPLRSPWARRYQQKAKRNSCRIGRTIGARGARLNSLTELLLSLVLVSPSERRLSSDNHQVSKVLGAIWRGKFSSRSVPIIAPSVSRKLSAFTQHLLRSSQFRYKDYIYRDLFLNITTYVRAEKSGFMWLSMGSAQIVLLGIWQNPCPDNR